MKEFKKNELGFICEEYNQIFIKKDNLSRQSPFKKSRK